MNLQCEITNHLEWIDTIASLLGSEEMTEEALRVITQHNKCSLGHWLNSDASTKFKNLPEFEKLIESHDAFHKLAGSLITSLQLHKEAEAIELQTQFIKMSQKVINYIQILQENSGELNDEDNSDKGGIHFAALEAICCACDGNLSLCSTIYRCKASKVDTPL